MQRNELSTLYSSVIGYLLVYSFRRIQYESDGVVLVILLCERLCKSAYMWQGCQYVCLCKSAYMWQGCQYVCLCVSVPGSGSLSAEGRFYINIRVLVPCVHTIFSGMRRKL